MNKKDRRKAVFFYTSSAPFGGTFPSRGRLEGLPSREGFGVFASRGKTTAKKNRRAAVLLVVCQWELWYNTLDTL